MKFAIIGTGEISEKFIKCGNMCENFEAYALLSRNEERGNDFAQTNGVAVVYTDLMQMAQDECIDAVYVASPNSFHYLQTKTLLEHKKHVLLEKPTCSNSNELLELMECSEKNGVILLEAMRSCFNPAIHVLKDEIAALGKPRGAHISYSRYSSKYDRHKSGEKLNNFDPAFSNSALMDMGVYCVAFMLELLGVPKSICAKDFKMENGFSGGGNILCEFDDFVATLQFSKVATSHNPSEIFFENGTIFIEQIDFVSGVTVLTTDGLRKLFEKDPFDMRHEIAAFMKFCRIGVPDEHTVRSLNTMQIIDKAHSDCGISFPI